MGGLLLEKEKSAHCQVWGFMKPVLATDGHVGPTGARRVPGVPAPSPATDGAGTDQQLPAHRPCQRARTRRGPRTRPSSIR